LNQLDRIPADVGDDIKGRKMEDYEHTSLKPYVDMFEKHVAAVLRDSRGVKRAMKEENMSMDF